jgi:hypothetical protein
MSLSAFVVNSLWNGTHIRFTEGHSISDEQGSISGSRSSPEGEEIWINDKEGTSPLDRPFPEWGMSRPLCDETGEYTIEKPPKGKRLRLHKDGKSGSGVGYENSRPNDTANAPYAPEGQAALKRINGQVCYISLVANPLWRRAYVCKEIPTNIRNGPKVSDASPSDKKRIEEMMRERERHEL